jgi:hypothetical protein
MPRRVARVCERSRRRPVGVRSSGQCLRRDAKSVAWAGSKLAQGPAQSLLDVAGAESGACARSFERVLREWAEWPLGGLAGAQQGGERD